MSTIKANYSTINVTAINAFSDNYIWAISSKNTHSNKTILVDPGDAAVCIEFIEQGQLTLSAILITHHHPDHTGGIKELVAYCQEKQWPLTVYGPASENIPHCNVKLAEKDTVNLADINVNLQVIDLPGHTAGHIAYFVSDSEQPALFCGDTLFSGGCGRLFEGTAKQMLHSLTKLANLPESTKVYCAHEYTQANLKFALVVEPQNEALLSYCKKVTGLRAKAATTIPSTIGLEKQINPFLRSHELAVQASAKRFASNTQATNLDTFTAIRSWKDQF